MSEFLDQVLGTLEQQPLEKQFSELAKNDCLGTPKYVRGVVMTKAYFDQLKRCEALYAGHGYGDYRTDTFAPGPIFSKAQEAMLDKAPLEKKRPASPKWWDEGGWD